MYLRSLYLRVPACFRSKMPHLTSAQECRRFDKWYESESFRMCQSAEDSRSTRSIWIDGLSERRLEV